MLGAGLLAVGPPAHGTGPGPDRCAVSIKVTENWIPSHALRRATDSSPASGGHGSRPGPREAGEPARVAGGTLGRASAPGPFLSRRTCPGNGHRGRSEGAGGQLPGERRPMGSPRISLSMSPPRCPGAQERSLEGVGRAAGPQLRGWRSTAPLARPPHSTPPRVACRARAVKPEGHSTPPDPLPRARAQVAPSLRDPPPAPQN